MIIVLVFENHLNKLGLWIWSVISDQRKTESFVALADCGRNHLAVQMIWIVGEKRLLLLLLIRHRAILMPIHRKGRSLWVLAVGMSVETAVGLLNSPKIAVAVLLAKGLLLFGGRPYRVLRIGRGTRAVGRWLLLLLPHLRASILVRFVVNHHPFVLSARQRGLKTAVALVRRLLLFLECIAANHVAIWDWRRLILCPLVDMAEINNPIEQLATGGRRGPISPGFGW